MPGGSCRGMARSLADDRRLDALAFGFANHPLDASVANCLEFPASLPCPCLKSAVGPMTIAACYLSNEAVVLGADSTTTFPGLPERHYNHAQKVFEIGQNSTLGLVTWGLGSLDTRSFRTMVAELSDSLQATPVASGIEVINRWKDMFWAEFANNFQPERLRLQQLALIQSRTPEENEEYFSLRTIGGGFCIGGRLLTNRTPFAYEWLYGLEDQAPNNPNPLPVASPTFWGCPNLIYRLLLGMDDWLFQSIVHSGKWNGTEQELFDLLKPHVLGSPGPLPLRDAIDWIHSAILITIKAMKFSQLSPVCGGPIEIATITTDRPFRWVTHKGLDEALDHHRPRRRTKI